MRFKFSMLFRPISDRSQVVAVTDSGVIPISNMRTTWVVLSFPPLTGTMQSQCAPSCDLYCWRTASSSRARASQLMSPRASKLRHALHTPWASSFKSGLVSGITHFVQYRITGLSLSRPALDDPDAGTGLGWTHLVAHVRGAAEPYGFECAARRYVLQSNHRVKWGCPRRSVLPFLDGAQS